LPHYRRYERATKISVHRLQSLTIEVDFGDYDLVVSEIAADD